MKTPTGSRLKLVIEVPALNYPGIRLDRALFDALKHQKTNLTRGLLKPYFERKEVLSSGKTALPSTSLPPGAHTIEILNWDDPPLPSSRVAQASPRGSFLPILYESDELLILDKKSGIPSLPHSPEEHETAVSSALAHEPALANVGAGGMEPGLLHRLDTGTSGILVFAKTSEEFNRVRALWAKGHVKKIYRAWVAGQEDAQAMLKPRTLDWMLAHDKKSKKKMIAFPDGIRAGSRYRGRPLRAITKLVRLHGIKEKGDLVLADLEVEILTGVMHQIRCTLSTIGWPVLGDAVYGQLLQKTLKSPRLGLHAWRIEIPLKNGETLKVESPLAPFWDRLPP